MASDTWEGGTCKAARRARQRGGRRSDEVVQDGMPSVLREVKRVGVEPREWESMLDRACRGEGGRARNDNACAGGTVHSNRARECTKGDDV